MQVACWQLARYPDKAAKLQAELDAHPGAPCTAGAAIHHSWQLARHPAKAAKLQAGLDAHSGTAQAACEAASQDHLAQMSLSCAACMAWAQLVRQTDHPSSIVCPRLAAESSKLPKLSVHSVQGRPASGSCKTCPTPRPASRRLQGYTPQGPSSAVRPRPTCSLGVSLAPCSAAERLRHAPALPP